MGEQQKSEMQQRYFLDELDNRRSVHWPTPRKDWYREDPRPRNFYDQFSDFLQEKFGV